MLKKIVFLLFSIAFITGCSDPKITETSPGKWHIQADGHKQAMKGIQTVGEGLVRRYIPVKGNNPSIRSEVQNISGSRYRVSGVLTDESYNSMFSTTQKFNVDFEMKENGANEWMLSYVGSDSW